MKIAVSPVQIWVLAWQIQFPDVPVAAIGANQKPCRRKQGQGIESLINRAAEPG